MATHQFNFNDGAQDDFSRNIPLSPTPNRNPFEDTISRRSSASYNPGNKAWDSNRSAVTVDEKSDNHGKHRFKSYRLRGTYEKPWQDDPRMKKASVGNWIVRVFVFLGFALCAYINYATYAGVAKHDVSCYQQ